MRVCSCCRRRAPSRWDPALHPVHTACSQHSTWRPKKLKTPRKTSPLSAIRHYHTPRQISPTSVIRHFRHNNTTGKSYPGLESRNNRQGVHVKQTTRHAIHEQHSFLREGGGGGSSDTRPTRTKHRPSAPQRQPGHREHTKKKTHPAFSTTHPSIYSSIHCIRPLHSPQERPGRGTDSAPATARLQPKTTERLPRLCSPPKKTP